NLSANSPGWITAITGALRLRDDGATLHFRASGSLATPGARAFYAAPPPPELAAAAVGVPTGPRLHLAPTSLLQFNGKTAPELRSELIEQLTGDVEIVPSGRGFANATLMLPVHDVARVEAFVKKRCAESAAKNDRDALGRFKVEGHGCAAVFD